MTLSILFVVSGLAISALVYGKVLEERRKSKPMLLRLVSLGDEHVRTLSHVAAHKYAELREKAEFFLHKQLPLHTKNFVNKSNVFLKERAKKHIGDIRGSKFLKKSDGLNEFFKSISEKENDSQKEEEGVE